MSGNDKASNIIFILADDMGYGDLGANNPDSRIPTPHLDRMAAEGMRFTNAHAGSSVCTPSRYHILTGRYAWRSRLKQGIVWEWDAPLIEPHERTVAHLLKDAGYSTHCLGKWHLGWDWATRDGRHPNDSLPFGQFRTEPSRHAFSSEIDFAARIGGGPVDRGFDSYFGVDVPNFPPYTWFENDRLTAAPSEEKPDRLYGNPGPAVPGWELEPMIPEFTRRAVELIESKAHSEEPFFLYFPLTSPHSPIVPNEPFRESSDAGNYGDFICEVDWIVGELRSALERTGQAGNTLLIFTSDNGPELRTRDDLGAYERIREYDHHSMGPLRGVKRDVWEGGHRVPFLACQPGKIPAETTCDQLVTLGDFYATCADLAGIERAPADGPDSVSLKPLLDGDTGSPVREHAIHHSSQGRFAVRRGDWLLIDDACGGDNDEPDWWRERRGYTRHDQPGELFNLSDDLSERSNRFADEPAIVAELKAILEAEKRGE